MRLSIIGYKPERLERTIFFCKCGGKYSIYKNMKIDNFRRHSGTKRHIRFLKKNKLLKATPLS
jgi:hypothetical protein